MTVSAMKSATRHSCVKLLVCNAADRVKHKQHNMHFLRNIFSTSMCDITTPAMAQMSMYAHHTVRCMGKSSTTLFNSAYRLQNILLASVDNTNPAMLEAHS